MEVIFDKPTTPQRTWDVLTIPNGEEQIITFAGSKSAACHKASSRDQSDRLTYLAGIHLIGPNFEVRQLRLPVDRGKRTIHRVVTSKCECDRPAAGRIERQRLATCTEYFFIFLFLLHLLFFFVDPFGSVYVLLMRLQLVPFPAATSSAKRVAITAGASVLR